MQFEDKIPMENVYAICIQAKYTTQTFPLNLISLLNVDYRRGKEKFAI